MGIVGDLGTGKTQLTQSLVYRFVNDPKLNRNQKPRFLIFDYKNDYSSEEFVQATGAKVVSPYDLPLNVFDTTNCENRNPQLERFKFFFDLLDKIFKSNAPIQKAQLKDAVKQAYRAAQIAGYSAPLISEVKDHYLMQTKDKKDSTYNIIDDIVDAEIFSEDREKITSFEDFMDGIVVVNLKELGQDDLTKNLIVIIMLNFFYEYMLKIEKKPFISAGKEDLTLRFIHSMLLVDEADNIMKYGFDVLRKVLLQGREFGVGVILSSQYFSHFKVSRHNIDYREPLNTWFIHKVPNVDVPGLKAIGLSNPDNEMVNKIRDLQPHECLYKTFDVPGEFIRGIPFYEYLSSK